MTKTLSIRLDDHVASLVSERATRHGVSINQEISDALLRDAEHDVAATRKRAAQKMAKFSTVMERLA